MSYLWDANSNGLIDFYFAAERPRVDVLVPGVLFINQGDRTWKENRDVSEYSQAMILTDADGDGLANEFVVTRDHCFAQKAAPYSNETLEFCKTRPVGTTAVYKFNVVTRKMEDIGKRYSDVEANNAMNLPCCPVGKGNTFAEDNRNCYVQSTALGDFDDDLLADQVFLYGSKVVFYFSSDRPAGVLPFGGQWIGAEIYLPQHCRAKALRVVDLDNDGREEILVGCMDPGTFLVYTRGTKKDDWTLLDSGCDNDGDEEETMGDLNIASLAGIWESDYESACEKSSRVVGFMQLGSASLAMEMPQQNRSGHTLM